MKKNILAGLLLSTIFLTGACSADEAADTTSSSTVQSSFEENNNETETSTNQEARIGERTLVIYYSVPETAGTDAVAGASRVVENGEVIGNTEQIAKWIVEETSADLFEITTVDAYPGDHDELVNQGREEHANDTRPELSSSVSNLENYDTIFIGYPVWMADLPMAVYSFLDDTDLSGKTLIPFSTHGGSGFASTISTIVGLESNATVETENVLTVSRNNISTSNQEVIEWVNSLGY